MSKEEVTRRAELAVATILENLRQSDFVGQYGEKAVAGLAEYRLDMVADIVKAMLA
jgi:hypothetical protein